MKLDNASACCHACQRHNTEVARRGRGSNCTSWVWNSDMQHAQHIDLTGCNHLSAAKLVKELLHGRVLDSLSLDGCDLRECKLEELHALVPSGCLDVDICMSCRKIARLNDWETCSACSPCIND